MYRKHSHENRYCGPCKRTTRHEIKDSSFCCETCGSIKRPPQLVVKREEPVEPIVMPA